MASRGTSFVSSAPEEEFPLLGFILIALIRPPVPDSHLAHLLASCTPLKPLDRATLLEDDEQLESAYKAAALQGDSEVPGNPEDEVDFHYVCFVKSHKNGHLYELDGDRKGPVDWGRLDSEDDVLSEKGLGVIREFIGGISRGVGFSLLALAPAE